MKIVIFDRNGLKLDHDDLRFEFSGLGHFFSLKE